ncbi:MAG TPA: hypothetical protein GXZ77_06930 [Papillibacter sp.]|nr:hypothetical protein [Papillibacter sp.]
MKLSLRLARLGYGAFALFAALLFFLGLFRPVMSNAERVAAGVLLFCPTGAFALWGLSAFISRWKTRRAVIFLAVLCLAVKLLWVLTVRVAPAVDYKTFYDTAAALAERGRISSRYAALFPHIMGYALFLSGLFRMFGKGVEVAILANVVISTLSMLLIFYICDKIASRRAAVAAALLWTGYPAQTMFNMFVLSEPLYSLMLLLIWAAVVYVEGRMDFRHQGILVAAGVILPLMLALLNMLRPIALVQLLAFLIYAALGLRKNRGVKRARLFAVALSVLICYFSFGAMTSAYLTERLGENPATLPGYNIYVGFNPISRGTWNQEDSARLFQYSARPGWDAGRTQRQMLQDALNRLRGEKGELPSLLLDKFLILLGDDSAAVFYAGDAIPQPRMAAILSNVFYYSMVLLALVGAVKAMREKSISPLLMISLFGLGLTAAQLLVEVAGRYHYSISLSLLITAACAFGKNTKDNDSYSHKTDHSTKLC